MANFKKGWLLALAAVLIVAVLGGCSKQLSLKEMSPQEYTHSSGYSVQIPVNWQLATKDEQGVLFTADQGAVAVLILSEIGGVDYYTPEELANNLAQWLGGQIGGFELLETLDPPNGQREAHQLWRGETADGAKIYADVCSFAAANSVHYYLVMLAGGEDYYTYEKVFADVLDSFRMSDDYDSIYKQLSDEYHQGLFEDVVKDMIEELKVRFGLTDEAAEDSASEDSASEQQPENENNQ